MLKITLNDIAQKAGVSRSLVSFYLSHPETTRVAEDTGKRNQEAVRQLGYRRNENARALRSGKSHAIGLLIGGITESFQAFLAQSLMNELKKYGYRLRIGITNYDQKEEQSALDDMLSQQVDAIFYDLFLDENSAIAKRMLANHFPILLHQRSEKFNSIGYDDREGFAGAVCEFRRRNCRSVAFLESRFDHRAAQFIEYARKAEIDVTALHYDNSTESQRAMFDELIRLRPDGLFSTTGPTLPRKLFRCLALQKIEYQPKSMFVRSWRQDVLEDYRPFIGAVNYSAEDFVKLVCRRLLTMIENPQVVLATPIHSSFVTQEALRQLDRGYENELRNDWNSL